MLNITYGDRETDFDALPEVSRRALALGGLAHKLGNEVSAKIGAEFRKQAREAWKTANGGDEGWSKLTESERSGIEKAGVPATDSAEYTALKAKFVADQWSALLDGSIGIRESAPKRDPFEVECDRIVSDAIVKILKANLTGKHAAFGKNGTKTPEEDAVFTLGGTDHTFGSLKAKYATKYESKVHKEAQKILDARRKSGEEAGKMAIDDLLG